MVADRSKPQASVGPPRTVYVDRFAESRASELVALHSIVASRLNNDFRSQRSKRRRTTGHDNRVSKKRFRKEQKVVTAVVSSNVLLEKDENKVPRRIRRRMELKKNPQTGFSASGDGTKRLRTHVWHAKRFTMNKLWGFYLPLGLHGRGRGSRALLKKLKQGVLVHDASYYGAIQLEGPEELLLSLLSTIMVPFPSGSCDQAPLNILSGVSYGSAMLHHVGAVYSRAVAPVTYMWRPQHSKLDSRVDNTGTYDKDQRVDCCASPRQLWVWIHPAAFREGYVVLESACKRIDVTGSSVTCVSLVGELAKLELIGVRAFQLIQKILHPVTCISQDSCALQKCSVGVTDGETLVKSSYTLSNEDQISTSAIISLMVHDPRSLTGKGNAVVSGSEPSEALRTKENEVQGQTTLVGIPKGNMDFLSSISLKPEESCQFSEFSELWDAHKGLIPPLQENFLSNEKHCQRMKFLNIDENLGNLDAPGKGQSSQMCPIMLLKNIQDGFTPRWSIILPLSWVKAFWITIIFNGAQAIGLREKHWIVCDAGLPYFPSDFPECNAYSCFKAMETAIMDQKANLRPPVLRPLRVPILLPWDCVQCGSHERSITAGDTEVLPVSDNSMQNINCEKCGIPAVGGHGSSFDGFVARTSYKLIHFLTHISGDHLLLFPNLPDGKRCLTNVMKDEEIINQQTNGISLQFTCCQKLCFVRVLLNAYKEGVFEEGAVVCAPRASDITMWTARSEDDDDGKIQVHQSLLGSYFVQQPSGRWELQVPEDPVVRESHRWPIGFVTTGFVIGSKKPRAIALCDAVLLARLREEQWKTVSIRKRRKEIYVLVRNLRSTAYRLALATIVLEEREDDVEYM